MLQCWLLLRAEGCRCEGLVLLQLDRVSPMW